MVLTDSCQQQETRRHYQRRLQIRAFVTHLFEWIVISTTDGAPEFFVPLQQMDETGGLHLFVVSCAQQWTTHLEQPQSSDIPHAYTRTALFIAVNNQAF
jgi:hypothetical protein